MTSKHRPTTQKAFILLIMVLGSVTAIGPLTIDMYLPAFSALSESFAASKNMVQLSLTSCFIGLAFGQLFYGPIIDRFGKKLPLYVGLTIFTIASIACFLVENIEHLIICRFFQALGACAGLVIPRAIVRDIFTAQESARVFSHLMLVIGLAPILAPLFGNLILISFGWQAIFAFLTIFGILCLTLCRFAIPQTKGPNPEEKISGALKKYFEILQDRNFVVCAVSGGFMMAGLFSYITASPFAYLDFFAQSSRNYSLIFAINSVGFVAMAQLNAHLLKKIPMEKLLGKFLLVPLISGILLIIIGLNNPTFFPFTIVLFVFLSCVGAIAPTTTAVALSHQLKHSGSASALFGTIQFTFATIASFLLSNLHDGTLTSMSIVISSCGILSCLTYKLFHRKHAVANLGNNSIG